MLELQYTIDNRVAGAYKILSWVDQIAKEAMGKFKAEWESRYDAPDFDEIVKLYSPAMVPGLGSMMTEISILRPIPMNNKH